MEERRLISVVVPVYREEAVIEQTYAELTATLAALPSYRYELLFVDDGSTDGTPAILGRIAARDPHVKLIRF
jgi:dolichol-phosphate mannosyltransferase